MEKTRATLTQVLVLRPNDIGGRCEYIKDRHYLSHDITNELIRDIVLMIIRQMLENVSCRQWFSVDYDGTADGPSEDQLCITIQTVDESYEIREDLLGLYYPSRQSAVSIGEVSLDVSSCCGLSMASCREQGYYEVNSMAGLHPGVATLLLQQPKAMFVHCSAHCLDLVIQALCCNWYRD